MKKLIIPAAIFITLMTGCASVEHASFNLGAQDPQARQEIVDVWQGDRVRITLASGDVREGVVASVSKREIGLLVEGVPGDETVMLMIDPGDVRDVDVLASRSATTVERVNFTLLMVTLPIFYIMKRGFGGAN